MKIFKLRNLSVSWVHQTIIAVTSALIISGHANAIPINYDESVDGDLDGSQNLLLGFGTNTVMGSITFSNNSAVITDFDSFDFTVAGGNLLTSMTIDIALLPVGSGIFNNSGWVLNGSISQSVPIPSTGLSLFTSALPLSSGSFSIANSSLSGSLATGEWRTAAYTLSLDVTSVPEPSILVLFSLGIAGLGIGRIRQRKRLQ